jgi:hypothetical protein
MPRPKKGKEKGEPTRATAFRLEDEVLAKLDAIAAYHTAETGLKVTRAGAVRLSVQKEYDRIRRRKEGAE